MADKSWMKVMAALGRPPWQRIDDAPRGAPETPGAQAARWYAEIDADLAAKRISHEEAERRKRAVAEWLAQA